MSRALAILAPATCLFALCACSSEPELVDSLPDAAECAWPYEHPVAVEGEHGLTATYECPDPRGCDGKAFMPGTTLQVGLELDTLRSKQLEVLTEDAEGAVVRAAFSLARDPCTDRAIASGAITLGAAGPITLTATDDGEPLDAWTFTTRRAASVELEVAGDAGEYEQVSELVLAQGEALSLRALAFDADGAPLVTEGAVFWVDDAQIAGLGDDDEPELRAPNPPLIAKRSGSTDLHVLVSNIEQIVSVDVSPP